MDRSLKLPETLEECYLYIDKLGMEDLKKFLNLPEEKALAVSHHGFGTMIRNELGLWEETKLTKWFKEKDIYHADDMSGIVILSYHRHKNGRDIKLDK